MSLVKAGIALIIIGAGISIFFGVSPTTLLVSPPVEIPIDPANSFLWVVGATSGSVIIIGVFLLLVGLVGSKNQIYE